MVRGFFSSPRSDLSLEDALDLANEQLDDARKAKNKPTKALSLCNDAKSKIKDAEKIFLAKKTGGLTLHEGIASAYHEHAQLLDDLGYHDKAKKSHSRAEKWGYVQVVSQQSVFPQPGALTSSVRRSFCPPAVLAATPSIATATYQGASDPSIKSSQAEITLPAETNNPTPQASGAIAQVPERIFHQNIAPPVEKYALPDAGSRLTSTPQLAYCLSLLSTSPVSKEGLDDIEREWSLAKAADSYEQVRLQSMATSLVRAFVRDELKKPDVVAEIVCLTAVLDQVEFRKVLQVFVDGIEQSMLLDVHLLDGLAQLVRNAAPGYIDTNDLVNILGLLKVRLEGTHEHATRHMYRLALTVSRVLDSMVDSQVKGLKREHLHEPLSEYFKELQGSSDPYLVYQAAYAYQALQYIPDDETILQTMLRRTEKVVQGISGVVSAVKALDLVRFTRGLQNIQDGLAGAEISISLVHNAYQTVVNKTKSGQSLLECLNEGFSFSSKSAWYPALRGLDTLLQEGHLAEFEKLMREAPCRKNAAFQWGVCQRLGELASGALWDTITRQHAVSFLGELYKDDTTWGQQADVKRWIIYILRQLAESSDTIATGHVQELLLELEANGDATRQALFQSCLKDYSSPYPLLAVLPPHTFPLLSRVQDKPDVESDLRRLKRERLKERGGDVYIFPRAKANSGATEDFDLTSKVQDFLVSDKKVFLLLGDSGAGKSTFNRVLEASLWEKYEPNGRIPLFIHLPTIDKPEHNLISKQLQKSGFTEEQIRELRIHHEFILICDGYDESQQNRNLYTSNHLNKSGGWHAQMVISCRTEYNGVDYKYRFQPNDRNVGGNSELFQEAIIAPFNQNQIQDYIDQYVASSKPLWQSGDYLRALKTIPNLQALVRNPFLLKLALDVLPRLVDIRSDLSAIRVTRIELYDEFLAHWLERSKIRLGEMQLSSLDKEAFKMISNIGFKQHGIKYLKELATAIYDNQSGNPVIKYSELRDQQTWKEPFFGKKDERSLLQEAIPLVRSGDQYRFIHKSVLEYGLTLAIFDPSGQEEYVEPSSGPSRRGSVDSVESFEIPTSMEKTPIATERQLIDSPLGRKNFVGDPSILQFLVERAQQQPVFKDQLHAVIQQSKADQSARIAAANAITVLVKAGVQFNGVDLQGIKIPGADLSFGVFDSVHFEGSDLRKVNLRSTWLRKANFSGAQMKGAQFGELPFLQEESYIHNITYSPDGKMFAAGLLNGDISLYETSNWERLAVLKDHRDDVWSLTFSTSSKRLVSWGRDATVRLWDVSTFSCIILTGHDGDVRCVTYSPNDDQVASGGADKTVRLWNAETGSCTRILACPDEVNSVTYSTKGDRLASGSRDFTLLVWDVKTGERLRTLNGHGVVAAHIVAYSPNGDQIASADETKKILLWNFETDICMQTIQGHDSTIVNLKYSPNGNQVASASRDSTIKMWNAMTGECLHVLDGHSDWIYCISYSPEGDQLASTSSDCTVRLWDIESGNCIQTLQGHGSEVTHVVYSPKGDQLASASGDRTVRLWDRKTGHSIQALHGHNESIVGAVCSPKRDRIASSSRDQTVKSWDAETGECIHTLQGEGLTSAPVVYSPQGDLIAAANGDNTLKLLDAATGSLVQTLKGHDNIITAVAYSPKGNEISSGNFDGKVRVWDIKTGECVHTLQSHDLWISKVAYSPTGDQIASASLDPTVRLWDAETGNCIHTLQGHILPVLCIVYSPKGDQLASGSEDTTVKLWGTKIGNCTHVLEGHSGGVHSVVYSPKGDQIASGSDDKTVRLWNVDTGHCIHTLEGHKEKVDCIAYSPQGNMVASGSRDMTVRLWSIETGQCLVTISGFSGWVNSIACEGRYLVTGSEDKSVRRWQIVKERDEYEVVLCWSSSHSALTVADATFDNLGTLNSMLLIQRGAVINPSPTTE
ncbi:hypothetical protein BGX26_000178 [Mortierella sp. AD094]|nr:hypothetical protein BGX26_000178 [Mortierella sp. AD094]